jgi:hypothetical protein
MKNIKSITSYIVTNDSPAEEIKHTFTEYDRDGNIVCAIQYTSDESIESKIISRFENGKLIEETNFFSEEEIAEKSVYKRNAEGEIDQIEINYADGSKTRKIYDRSQPDGTIIITSLGEDDEQEEKEVFCFNQHKNITEKSVFDENDDLISRISNEYDDNQRLISHKEIERKEKLATETLYTYDEKGNVIKRRTVTGTGKLADLVLMKYDEKGNMIERQVNNYYINRYEFNDSGKMVKEVHTNLHDNLENITQYGYDDEMQLTEESNALGKILHKYVYFE